MRLPPFERVVERHGDDVWRFSVSQVGIARADDVFQDTMLAALGAYPTLRDPGAVRPWLLRIAARKAVDRFRDDARAPAPVEAPEPPPALPADAIAGPDDELWARVRELPEKQRQAVALRFVLDLRYADVAAAMDTTVEAARRNVFEGVRTLRAELAGAA
jgi:RNA polymerase sigma factor (sigma-70 family)